MFIPIGEANTPDVREAFREQDVPLPAYYLIAEVGMIGVECAQDPGSFTWANAA